MCRARMVLLCCCERDHEMQQEIMPMLHCKNQYFYQIPKSVHFRTEEGGSNILQALIHHHMLHGHVINLNTVLDVQISMSTDVLWAQWAHCPKKNRREVLSDVWLYRCCC